MSVPAIHAISVGEFVFPLKHFGVSSAPRNDMEAGPVCGRARIGKPQMGHTENAWEVEDPTDELASLGLS